MSNACCGATGRETWSRQPGKPAPTVGLALSRWLARHTSAASGTGSPINPIATTAALKSSGRVNTNPNRLRKNAISTVGSDADASRIVTAISPTPAGEGKTTTSVGLTEGALQNTADYPVNDEAREAVLRSGGGKLPITQNCSGKHAGLLLACRLLGLSPKGYWRGDHPLQRAIRRRISDLTSVPERDMDEAVDGCGLVVYRIPLSALALGYARLLSRAVPGENAAQAAARPHAERWSTAGDVDALDRRLPEGDGSVRDVAFQVFRRGLAYVDGMDMGALPASWLDERAPDDLVDGPAQQGLAQRAHELCLIRSMTGFGAGRGEGDHAVRHLVVVKAIDHSHLLQGLVSRSRDFR